MNARNVVSILVFVSACVSFVSLAFLPVPVSTTLTSVGETWSPFTTVILVRSTTATQLSLLFEAYTQAMTTTQFLAAFQGLGRNDTSLLLLGIFITAIMVLAATLLIGYSPKGNANLSVGGRGCNKSVGRD